MISLEQVQLLETRVANAIEYVKRVTEENSSLAQEKDSLLTKLEATQQRLDELESLVMRFKEDQGRIEDGIMAALNRLSQFEEAFEDNIKDKRSISSNVKKAAVKKPAEKSVLNKFFEIDEVIEEPRDNSNSSDDGLSASKLVETSDGELDIF